MKNITRALALLLALVLILGLVVTGFAEGAGNTITVENAVSKQTYKIYKMLDLSVSAEKDAFSYTVNSDWDDFFKAGTETTTAGPGNAYVTIDDQGYVAWNANKEIAEFAKAAETFANTLPSTACIGTETPTTDGNITFSNLAPGYYLVTSSLGTNAIVDTTPTKQTVTIGEKNQAPSNKKEVKEDSTDTYGKVNDADIGDKIEFKSTITAQAGAKKYVFHDKMSSGLTLIPDPITVSTNNSTVNAENNYKLKTSGLSDGCAFEIEFEQSFCDKLTAGQEIIITYAATLNANAVVGTGGNTNTSKVSYGDNATATPDSTTKTYTWSFDVEKHAQDENGKVLANAEFVLLNSDKTEVAVFNNNGLFSSWETTTEQTSTWADNNKLKTGDDGKFVVKGLDAGTYYLKEIQAPAGYNKLKGPVEVKIEPNKDDTTHTITLVPVTMKVVNQTGAEMPSTGGIGTTVFYVVGGILVVGAAVLLVTKKRMERG